MSRGLGALQRAIVNIFDQTPGNLAWTLEDLSKMIWPGEEIRPYRIADIYRAISSQNFQQACPLKKIRRSRIKTGGWAYQYRRAS